MMAFLHREHGADHVRAADRVPAVRLFRWRSARRLRPVLRLPRHRARRCCPQRCCRRCRCASSASCRTTRCWRFRSSRFMGLILERSGMAEDLLDTIGQLFGPMRGGLAYAVIFVGAMLAATTGVVAASVISMGLISLPIMLRYGYDRRVASGVIAASGTLAQIIPPSLVLIVLADQLGRSVGDMYKGAFIPGFVLTALYARYILAASASSGRNGCRRCRRRRARSARTTARAGLRSLLGARDRRRSLAARRLRASPARETSVPTDETDRRLDVRRRRRRVRARGGQQAAAPGPAVPHGRARTFVLIPPLAADLPGAGHDLPRHRHADRRRRDGRHRAR